MYHVVKSTWPNAESAFQEMSKSKSKSGGGLGRSLIKDRNKSRRHTKDRGEGWLHSSELDDGYEWGRLNLRSVTEESRLEEFLNTAELAGIEFKAEKLNIKVVNSGIYTGLPSEQERAEAREAEEQNRQYLSIPRRPEWDKSTSAEQLELRERESFLEWRRSLVHLQEDDRLILTPFERNLEFWRQLWRVVERSDILVQIVDARNPLLFRCEDLEKYVLEISPKKVNMILISKADLLTPRQRQIWANYFRKNSSVVVAFWSALLESERLGEGESVDVVEEGVRRMEEDTEEVRTLEEREEVMTEEVRRMEETEEIEEEVTRTELGAEQMEPKADSTVSDMECDGKLLTGEELVALFHKISCVPPGSLTTVGMVGYPNVGKSSTINALFQDKKVPVSATPGRTKHFQTLYLSADLLVCDCPGLVFPSFLSSKAEMVCCGILPIDQLRDHTPPVSLVCERLPRSILEAMYGIQIPPPGEGEDQSRPPYAHELLAAYGYMRGFMTSHGQPDEPRSARYILKDYVNGKLLFCHPPPGLDEGVFNEQLLPDGLQGTADVGAGQLLPLSEDKTPQQSMGEFDCRYFRQEQVRVVTKERRPQPAGAVPTEDGAKKPWKKHNNRHKKEKTRRTVPNAHY